MSFHENDKNTNSNYQYISSGNTRKNNYSVSPGSMKYKKIGNYILLSTIGSGTFSTVKLGVHLPTQQKVAIKILDKNKINDENDIKRISREIHILSKLYHPNIAQLYETIPTENNIYIIMEYIEGHDLFQYIYSLSRLTELKASKLFRQLISCLEYIHTLGIVHRDIKPENILLNKAKTNIKLVDFGLSNSYKHGSLLKTACGSPCYASPEMISGKEYDPLYSDLWSCGVVLYCMLVGKLPFDDEDIKLLYYNIRYANYFMPPFLSNISQDFLRKILTPNPNKRIRIEELKKHPFFLIGEKTPLLKGILVGIEDIPVDEDIIKKMKNIFFIDNEKVDEKFIINNIKANHHNNITSIYYLMIKNSKEKTNNYNNYNIINDNTSKNTNPRNNNNNYNDINSSNNKINIKTNKNNEKNNFNNSLNGSINEISKQEENIFNTHNIKRISFNSNDLTLKSNDIPKRNNLNINQDINNKFNVVVINNILTEPSNNKIIKSKTKNNNNKIINNINSCKYSNLSNNKINYSNNNINNDNKNIYININTNDINKRTKSNNTRAKNKNLINNQKIIYNKKCVSRKEKSPCNINSKNKVKNSKNKKSINLHCLNNKNINNIDYISNANNLDDNSFNNNKKNIKVKEKENINLKKINFKFKDINYIDVNNKNNNNINNIEPRRVYNKNKKQKFNKIISRNNKLVYDNSSNKRNDTSHLTNSKIKNILINENYFENNNNNFISNRITKNFNKTFTKKNNLKTDDSILNNNKIEYNSLNVNETNNYSNNYDKFNSNSPSININCNNNVNIYINKNNKIKDRAYHSNNKKNLRNKICFNNDNIENINYRDRYNNILGFNLNNMILKEKLSPNSHINKRNNYSGIRKNMYFSVSKSKVKKYNINITLQNEGKTNNNNVLVRNNLKTENGNQLKISKLNSYINTSNITPNINKNKSPPSSNNIYPKTSFEVPINFNSPKTHDIINKINHNNNNPNIIGVSVNFSNVVKKNIIGEKIKKKYKNKEINNLNNINTMNDCLNKILNNNNYYIKNKIETPINTIKRKINDNRYYSTGKKNYFEHKIGKNKSLSINKKKENIIDNKYYIE